jgi:flagellar motor switch protein FliM
VSDATLSTEQIAALVEAAKEGQLPEREQGRQRRARRIREVDFSRPTKFTQEQQRRIERSHEAFCRATATRLTAELRMGVELELLNVAQLTWASALTEVPPASIFAVVEAVPLGTRIVVSAETGAIVWMMERLLGGGTSIVPARTLHRDLSEIELTLTRRLFGTVLAQLSLTWDELIGVQLKVLEIETAVANVQAAPPSEPTLALTIEMRADGTSSTISLLVPYRSIEQAVDKLPTGHYSELMGEPVADEHSAAAVRQALSGVDVELRAEVGGVEMTIEEVLALKEGDVVRLESPSTSGVLLCAGPVPVHRARPGRSGRRRAVSVIGRLEGSE